MFPTPTQLRMTRVAIGIDLRTVANDIGMSYSGGQVLEIPKANPTMKMINKLLTYYTSKGVEFGQNGWVRLRPADPS